MTTPEGLDLPYSDWPGRGVVPLRALAAEAATAEHSWREDSDTQWIGGYRKAVDVYGEYRRDAKAVRLDSHGGIVVARRNAERFDADAVDRITLVHMGQPATGWRVDLDAGMVFMAAATPILSMWDVPTDNFNAVMPVHTAADPVWRNVHVDPDSIARYRLT